MIINAGTAPFGFQAALSASGFRLASLDSGATTYLNPGDSLRLALQFSPRQPGLQAARLTFSEATCPVLVLTGWGENPDCAVEPGALAFGSMLVGEQRTLSVSVINRSPALLETRPQVTGRDFLLPGSIRGSVQRIPPGDTLHIPVTFRPLGGGERAGSLVFPEGFCADVPLTGWGDLVACVTEPARVDFPRVSYRDRPTRSVRITSTGTLPLEGTIAVDGAAFLAEAGAGPFRLEPGESREVRIRFAPDRSGAFTGSLSLGHPDCSPVPVSGAASRTWTIRESQDGDAPTVQAGIDSAAVGDTVLVEAGTYYEKIGFRGKDLVLRSAEGPERTILDGTGQDDSVVTFEAEESRACVLEGFTITGGTGTRRFGGWWGGGISCPFASATVRQNIIRGNSATRVSPGGGGGGIAVGSGYTKGPRPSPLIEANSIEVNVATNTGGGIFVHHPRDSTIIRGNVFRANTVTVGDGGALYVSQRTDGDIYIVDNYFIDNIANDHGGAIHLAYQGQDVGITVVEGNLILRNTAGGLEIDDNGSGGGIYSNGQHGTIVHNTIVLNTGGGESPCSGGGIFLRLGLSALSIRDNIIAWNDGCGVSCIEATGSAFGPNLLWQNLGGDFGTERFACPEGWALQALLSDPLFCDPSDDDFSLAADSPAFVVSPPMGAIPSVGCGVAKTVESSEFGTPKPAFSSRKELNHER